MSSMVNRRRVLARELLLVVLVAGSMAGGEDPPESSPGCPNKRSLSPYFLVDPDPDLEFFPPSSPFNQLLCLLAPTLESSLCLHVRSLEHSKSWEVAFRAGPSHELRRLCWPSAAGWPALPPSRAAPSVPSCVLKLALCGLDAGGNSRVHASMRASRFASLPWASFGEVLLLDRCRVQFSSICAPADVVSVMKLHRRASLLIFCLGQGVPISAQFNCVVEAGMIHSSEVALDLWKNASSALDIDNLLSSMHFLLRSGFALGSLGLLELGQQVQHMLLALSRNSLLTFISRAMPFVWILTRLLESSFNDGWPTQLESGVAPHKSTTRLPTSDAQSGSIARGVVGDASIGIRRRGSLMFSVRYTVFPNGRYRSPSLRSSAVGSCSPDFLVFKLDSNLSLFLTRICLMQNPQRHCNVGSIPSTFVLLF